LTAITFEIPPLADAFIFRRDILANIRAAIGRAQVDGEIAAAVAVACLRALPPPSPDKAV
jgi:hypothetical protein